MHIWEGGKRRANVFDYSEHALRLARQLFLTPLSTISDPRAYRGVIEHTRVILFRDWTRGECDRLDLPLLVLHKGRLGTGRVARQCSAIPNSS